MTKYTISILLILSLLGLIDASYLSYEHFKGVTPACDYSYFQLIDCGQVLRSSYASIMGVPLALIGAVHYLILTFWIGGVVFSLNKYFRIFATAQSVIGFLFSLYLVFVQLVILKFICLYCMASAIISSLIFLILFIFWRRARVETIIWITEVIYKIILKPILFKFDPESIHETMIRIGSNFASNRLSIILIKFFYKLELPTLAQEVKNLKFEYPVGLSAGFDYNADLTKTLYAWGFGFQTVGTVTNNPYGGNTKPRLARLPKSKSLLVNKGFKNLGADAIIKKLEKVNFSNHIGVSIGRTNSSELCSQQESVQDIVSAFKKFQKSKVKHSYYELNISCPNLHGSVEFYSPSNLKELLKAVDDLKLNKPVFVKMPIDKSNKETMEMLKIITEHRIAGVIFGNLQKDRKNEAFVKEEIEKFTNLKGNFSGKPTYEQSNELIKLAYKNFHKQLIIIGCGGIFDAKDAYEKIKNGASLIQMITGMVYGGPQTIMKINLELNDLLKKDGFNNIRQAVGANLKQKPIV